MEKQTTENPLVSIVVPLYNEEETVGDVLSRLGQLTKIRKEILVVDDGSKDNSLAVSKQFPFVTILHHNENRGKGAALKTGFVNGKGDIFVVQDADLEYSPEEIQKIVYPIIEGKADVVYGSRFLGKCVGMSFLHRLGNLILSEVVSLVFSRRITDVMTGHKAFSRNALRSFIIEENGFEVEIEITAKLLGQKKLRFMEIPISYTYRRKGHSKIGFRHGLTCLIKLLILGVFVRRP